MRFKLFNETIPKEMQDFKDFGALNQLIELDNLSPDQVIDAYHDMILRTLENAEKTNLHFQIQYLFDEVKIPVNRVLSFLEAKFSSLEDAISSVIKQTQLKDSGIWERMDILTGLEYTGVIKVVTSNIYDTNRKLTTELKLPEIETAQERYILVKDFLLKLDETIEYGDMIVLESRVMLNNNKLS